MPQPAEDEEPQWLLDRRTQKLWRHEDRGLNVTLSLCRMGVTVHALFIPIVGAFTRNGGYTSIAMFLICCAVSLYAIAIAINCMLVSRNEDFVKAAHFRITHRGKINYPESWDKNRSDEECRLAEVEAEVGLIKGLRILRVTFVVNVLILIVTVLIHD